MLLETLLLAALQAAATDAKALGPQPGAALPPFELEDQSGTRRSFATLAGERGLVLVFFRSADW
jgi:hypothetical protein